jgi:hypothetical protein
VHDGIDLGRVCVCVKEYRGILVLVFLTASCTLGRGILSAWNSLRIICSERFPTQVDFHLPLPVTRERSKPTKHRLIQTLSLNTTHVMSLSSLPAPQFGYIFLVASALLLAIGTHALLFSALFPPSSRGGTAGGQGTGTGEEDRLRIRAVIGSTTITVLDALARDTHYKYLALFSVPVCAYFVIANWVGWQFFRNS